MKKRISIGIMALLVTGLLTSCASFFSTPSRPPITYTNKEAGISFILPEGWVDETDRSTGLYFQGLEKSKGFGLLVGGGQSKDLGAEDITELPKAMTSYTMLSMMGLSSAKIERSEFVTINGQNYLSTIFTMKKESTMAKYEMLTTIHGDKVSIFIIMAKEHTFNTSSNYMQSIYNTIIVE